MTTSKCKDVFPITELQSLDSPRIIVKSPGITPLPGEISYISKILKPQLLHKEILAEFWDVMALHHSLIQIFWGNLNVMKIQCCLAGTPLNSTPKVASYILNYFLWPQMRNYIEEADADLIAGPGQVEIHGR